MPARFVEVVDVSTEAASLFDALYERGEALRVNATDYIRNATLANDLWDILAQSNASVEALSLHWHDALAAMGVERLAEVPAEYVPTQRASTFMLTALVLVLSREVFVRWRVRRLLKARGMHVH
jgi:hypothetical protein